MSMSAEEMRAANHRFDQWPIERAADRLANGADIEVPDDTTEGDGS